MTNYNDADAIINTESVNNPMFVANILEKCNDSDLVADVEQDYENEKTIFIFVDSSVIEVTPVSARANVSLESLSFESACDYSQEEMDYKLAVFFN